MRARGLRAAAVAAAMVALVALLAHVAATPARAADGPLATGSVAVVSADGDCLRLRAAPGLAATELSCLPQGARVDVLDGTVTQDGYRWQHVAFGALSGWAADTYLIPESALPPPPTPIPGDGTVQLFVPAPAGTEWQIAAGYNTATHSAADGGDPYAIDIVRTDAATAGTPVLAPLDGTVAWLDPDCLELTDRAGMRVLLCHFFHDPGVHDGLPVARGQRLGTVAPAGQAGNNGLAHIHVAVHYDHVNGGVTVPLAGAYAMEGTALPAVTTFNAYAGTTFRSTNVPPGATQPVVEGTTAPTPAPTSAATPVTTPTPAPRPPRRLRRRR